MMIDALGGRVLCGFVKALTGARVRKIIRVRHRSGGEDVFAITDMPAGIGVCQQQ